MYIKKMDKNSKIGGASLSDFDFSKLDRRVVKHKDRLKIIEEMLEDNTFFEELIENHYNNISNGQKFIYEDFEFALRLQAFANYLLFAQDTERGKQLIYNTYENKNTLDAKHRKRTLSLEDVSERLPNYESNIENLNTKNYKLSKVISFAKINKDEIVKKFPFIIDYYNFLKYIKENKECKITKNKIYQDIEIIADRHTIRFKNPLKESVQDIDLNKISFSDKKVVKYFMTLDEKDEYNLNDNFDILLYDFNNLYRSVKFPDKLQEIANLIKIGYSQKQIALKYGITQQQVSKYYNQIINKIIEQNNIYENKS